MTRHRTVYDDLYGQHRYQILNASALKLIAMCIMLIDHIGAAILRYLPELIDIPPERYDLWHHTYRITRNIGRSAFPIFCFFIVEGFYHTHNKAKYALRLLIFAFISQYPFELAIYKTYHWQYTNVFFTLFFGLLTIWGMSVAERRIRNVFLAFVVRLLCFATGCLAAYAMNTDYDCRGVLLIVIFYLFRSLPVVRTVAGYILFLFEPYCFPGFLMIHLYNGKRGRTGKYVFYLFYPLHLLILYLIRRYL